MDGEELGSGGPTSEGPRRAVSLIIRQSVDSSLSKMMQRPRRCKGFLLLHFLLPAVFLTISVTLFLRRMRILDETKEAGLHRKIKWEHVIKFLRKPHQEHLPP